MKPTARDLNRRSQGHLALGWVLVLAIAMWGIMLLWEKYG
jgi:hypothetical protein